MKNYVVYLLCFLVLPAWAQSPEKLDENNLFKGVVLGKARTKNLPVERSGGYSDGLVDVYKTKQFKIFEGSEIEEFLIYEDCCQEKNIFRLHLYFKKTPEFLKKLENKYGKGAFFETEKRKGYSWKGKEIEMRYIETDKKTIKLIFKFLSEGNEFDAW
jgi:hypothetical protein